MKNFKNLLLVTLLLMTCVILAQKKVSGKIIDETGAPLPGANIIEQGTTNGSVTDFDGNFMLKTKSNSGTIVISFVGYVNKNVSFNGKSQLGKISLKPSNTLEEVVIVGKGILDIAKDRETPIAVSTIKVAEIRQKLGNQEFPEILKATPSIYATKSSGGYGDSRINVRGFDQRNIAVIINGQPVNDMETGKVYWSNWSGLQDVASAIQIQRGLGASKLAVPSVGGTINIVTKATDRKEGGFAKFSAGNDNYLKTLLSYNTGLNEETGWAASFLFGRWQGDGYIDGTAGEGYSYFVSLGHKLSEKHSFNLTFTGAGQWHNQRRDRLKLSDILTLGHKHNANWGYLNGKEYNINRNFYNKPIASLNWDWDISEKLSLSSVFYGSWGRGGGTKIRGRLDIDKFRDSNNLIKFDDIVNHNRNISSYTGTNKLYKGRKVGTNDSRVAIDGISSDVFARAASINSHDWYGAVSNLKYEITENLTAGLGIDLRTYQGYHYYALNDLLGLDGLYSTKNKNNNGAFVSNTVKASPFKNLEDATKINFYNIGKVDWLGTNGIVEYKNEKLSGVIQGGISEQYYQRVDKFKMESDEKSHIKSILGGYAKGGINFNIDENHNVFGNAGLIKRQPNFSIVFPNYKNDINDDAKNETIISYELGYGYKSSIFNANLNLYRTTWKDRAINNKPINVIDSKGNTIRGSANFSGIEQLHSGVELELNAKPTEYIKIKGSFSYGDWIYKDNVTSNIFNNDQENIGTTTLYLENTKVGDAAQLTGSLGLEVKPVKNLKIDADWNYVGNLYADFSPVDRAFEVENNEGALKLPNYNLFDVGASYKVNFDEKYSLSFRVNVNNVLDTEYISESSTNIHKTDKSTLYKGIDVENQVWFGFGRTWNTSVTFNF